MNYEEINERINKINIENFVWLIYIGIICLNWYANKVEKEYFINNNLKSRNEYRKLMLLIFIILNIIYFYFSIDSYNELKKIKPTYSEQKKNLVFLSFIGSLLIFISGLIFIYIIIKDESIDVEIAFS